MSSLNTAQAKNLSDVPRLPFGSSTLDVRFGGIPAGSATMLVGTPDADVDAYAHTNAAMLMVARYFPGLYRGEIDAAPTDLPDEVHYVSVDRPRRGVLREMDHVLSTKQFNVLVEHLQVHDFSRRYAALAGTPEALRPAPDEAAEPVPGDDSFDRFVADLSERCRAVGPGNVVVIGSLTALEAATAFGLPDSAVSRFLLGLRTASTDWEGLVNVLYHARPDAVAEDERLSIALDGALYFRTGGGGPGGTANNTMRVGSFRGALSKSRQVVFDTAVGESGFRVSSSKNF